MKKFNIEISDSAFYPAIEAESKEQAIRMAEEWFSERCPKVTVENTVMSWNDFVDFCADSYGSVVENDEDSTFIICPECGEPIFEDDYTKNNKCPCCEFDFSEDFDT